MNGRSFCNKAEIFNNNLIQDFIKSKLHQKEICWLNQIRNCTKNKI